MRFTTRARSDQINAVTPADDAPLWPELSQKQGKKRKRLVICE
jgi:hypothetical protein